MSTLQHIRAWSATHHPRWLVILRIGLGLFLFAKGITFMRDSQLMERLLYGGSSLADNTTHFLPILITWLHLLGGLFITIGLMTRLMALLQLPILLGAIVFITAQKGGGVPESELWLAILTLLLLVFFLVEGSGPISLDAYFKGNRASGSQGRNLP